MVSLVSATRTVSCGRVSLFLYLFLAVSWLQNWPLARAWSTRLAPPSSPSPRTRQWTSYERKHVSPLNLPLGSDTSGTKWNRYRTTLFATLPKSTTTTTATTTTSSFGINGVGTNTTTTVDITKSAAVTISEPIQTKSSDHDYHQQHQATKPSALVAVPLVSEHVPFPVVLWRFTRPHTVIGSALAIPALHALAAPSYAAMLTCQALVSSVAAMIPALLMNLYITGVNQITDVDIDKINKPYLPIVAGQLSMRTAKVIVSIALASSLLMGAMWPFPYATQGLNVALWGSAILGTMYSLPPFRLKRFPFLAAFCIVAVRGTIINAGFFAHARAAAFGDAATAVGAAAVSSSSMLHYLLHDPKCILSSLYFGIFGIVIALMKDVPDVKGDRSSNVRTFSVRLGQTRVFHTVRRLLTGLLWGVGTAFGQGAWRASTMPLMAGRSIVAAVSFWAGFDVRQRGKNINPRDSKQVFAFYMYLWKIFYTSYLLLPFAR